eukprot:RCo042175
MLRRLRPLLKFENHVFRDASGAPWLGMDEWMNARHPAPPSRTPNFISRSGQMVNLTFVDMLGNVIRTKADQGQNLAEVAKCLGIQTKLNPSREMPDHPFAHMIVSSPHYERLVPPDLVEDEYLARLELVNTIHRNSRVIKFLWASPAMEGMVLVHPMQADVWTANQASPFTGRVEGRDVAVSPNLAVARVTSDDVPMPTFPGILECLRKGIRTFPELWDYTRARFLAQEAARNAWRKSS